MNKTANALDSPAIPSPPPERCHLSPCPLTVCCFLSPFGRLPLINSVSPSLHMLCEANDFFLMLCDSSGCHSLLHSTLRSISVESTRYPFPLCCSHSHCSCPYWSSYSWEPQQDLSILFYNPHVCCNPNPLFYLLPSGTCSPQPFNSPIERRWLDRNPRQLTLTCLGPIATRAMWHHVSSASGYAKGWSMLRSSHKLKYSSSHVYDLRGLWEELLLPPGTPVSLQELRPSCLVQGLLESSRPWSGAALRRWLSVTKLCCSA